jgi:hypothetical protein
MNLRAEGTALRLGEEEMVVSAESGKNLDADGPANT